jgi:hypothetical protein
MLRPARACALAIVLALGACGGSASPPSAAPLGKGRHALEPGVQTLDLKALDRHDAIHGPLPRVEITVPAGWSNLDGWALHKGDVRRPPVVLAFWHVARVYGTPCDWRSKGMIDPGSDVDGLTSTLAAQPLRNSTTPTDVELGGRHGKYLQLSVPRDIDFSDCDEGFFESWTADGWASDRYHQGPGQIDRLWILDVDGQRLVVDAAYMPEATAQERAELAKVVDSIRFVG